jgi:hypothetical protein
MARQAEGLLAMTTATITALFGRHGVHRKPIAWMNVAGAKATVMTGLTLALGMTPRTLLGIVARYGPVSETEVSTVLECWRQL